jgi:glucose-6-phosphate isomerase
MALQTINPLETNAWKKLSAHFNDMKSVSMRDLFAGDAHRAKDFKIQWEDFLVDYSKNLVTKDTMQLLRDLATECQLDHAIEQYFAGSPINKTENRAVMHTALRAPQTTIVEIDGINVMPDIVAVKEKIQIFTEAVLSGERLGYTGKPFTDVVNIGIGGSDLGPAMVVEALKFYHNQLKVHFVSNVEGDHVREAIKNLDPETTLFVIVSKTFTTQETLSNSETIRAWFLKFGTQQDIAKHFVAVSSNVAKAQEFGIHPDNIFPMWDWVGGRFSLWSAVGLSISLAVGYKNFDGLLRGAHRMDQHFKEAKWEHNVPVTLALISIWYNNFYGAETEAIIPYSQYLQKFAPYLQQGIMESNGKSIGRDGIPVNYQTGTIIWGEPGTNSQHAFFQLIHQGTKMIPADFIGFMQSLYGEHEHHDKLMSNFFAQTEALLNGKSEAVVVAEFQEKGLAQEQYEFLVPFKTFAGNKPTNTLLIKKLTPESLGSLIALYEHKIFVQGVIWNIFSYDQWGVELGKQLANNILDEMGSGKLKDHDSSTLNLIEHYLEHRK